MTDNFKYLSPQDFNKLGPAGKKRYLGAFYKKHLQTNYVGRLSVRPSTHERKTNNSAG